MIIICDIFLEGNKSGIDFANFVTENSTLSKIIYITSNEKEDILHNAQKTKPFAYLTKPFTEKQFLSTLEMARIKVAESNPKTYQLTKRELEVLVLLRKGRAIGS